MPHCARRGNSPNCGGPCPRSYGLAVLALSVFVGMMAYLVCAHAPVSSSLLSSARGLSSVVAVASAAMLAVLLWVDIYQLVEWVDVGGLVTGNICNPELNSPTVVECYRQRTDHPSSAGASQGRDGRTG